MKTLVEIKDKDGKKVNTVNYLFNDVAPRYINRPGGYTRIIKLGARRGDSAPMVILSWFNVGGTSPHAMHGYERGL